MYRNTISFTYILICLLLIQQGGMQTFNNRCSSLCCCLYSTSSFRLRHIEQRADSTYWIHKNNKPIKKCGMNNSITGPEDKISLILLHIRKTTNATAKTSPYFLCSRDWSLLHCLGWYTELGSAHCRQYLVFSRSVVIYSQGRREAIKSNSLQLKLYRVDGYEFPPFKINGCYFDIMNKSRN